MAHGLELGDRRFDPCHSDFGLLVIMVVHRICTAKVRVRFSYSPPSSFISIRGSTVGQRSVKPWPSGKKVQLLPGAPWSARSEVRTQDCQSCNTGSTPVHSAMKSWERGLIHLFAKEATALRVVHKFKSCTLRQGRLPEWLNGTVLKTVRCNSLGSSNPSSSAMGV